MGVGVRGRGTDRRSERKSKVAFLCLGVGEGEEGDGGVFERYQILFAFVTKCKLRNFMNFVYMGLLGRKGRRNRRSKVVLLCPPQKQRYQMGFHGEGVH